MLWQRNAYRRVRIASLTKMMTALHRRCSSTQPTDKVLVTKAAVHAAGSKVGVLPLHKHVRLETMLYGLLLPSGNDAAIALAQHVSGSDERVRAAHERRSGAARDGLHPLLLPLRLRRPGQLLVRRRPRRARPRRRRTSPGSRASRTRSPPQLPFPIKGGKLYLYNNNPLLIYHYPGTTGLKTGFTDAAGRCLVATAERDGVRLGVVVLDSDAPGTQAKQLLDRGFEHVYHLRPVAEPPMPPAPERASRAAPGADADPAEGVAPPWPPVGYRSPLRGLTGQSAKGEAVDLDDTPEQAAYRAQVRSWLDEHKSEAPVLSGPRRPHRTRMRSSPPAASGRASSPRAGSPA